MKHWLITFIILLCSGSLLAQKHDYIWKLGYDLFDNPTNGFGISTLNFNTDPLEMDFDDDLQFFFYISSTSYSDFDGNLLFYTNGLAIKNAQNETLLASDTFNDYYNHDLWYRFGLPMQQGIVALPINDDSIFLLYAKIDIGNVGGVRTGFGTGISYSLVNSKEDGGLGEMITKDVTVLSDTISQGGCILNTKHANGRDWWTIIPNLNSNVYHRILTTPAGPQLLDSQVIGEPVGNGLSQAAFSPDGTWYARNTITDDENDRLDLYRFDRVTGLLSSYQQLEYGGNSLWGGGIAFSPNNQFLYTIDQYTIYQFDLSAVTLEDGKSIVAEYDGFTEFIPNAHVPTGFYLAWNGPDGKIYICSDNATSYIHTIHYPNEKGMACQVEQHAIKLGSYHDRTVPNHPNYRLGPIDGSVCDTLGLDNMPLADWRYEIQADRAVRFTDNSWYEPDTWFWDFGDGFFSSDTSPYHTYVDTGVYEVCLTISNINDTDTFCRMVVVHDLFSATTTIATTSHFSVFPNPTDDYFTIISSDFRGESEVRMFDMRGELILRQDQFIGHHQAAHVDVSTMSTGVYILEIWSGDRIIGRKKVVLN